MYVLRRRTRIEIWAPAKLNLFLEVLGRRDDGFHEIETLMVPISLFDTLTLSAREDNQIQFDGQWLPGYGRAQDLSELPTDDSNLVVKALQKLRERSGCRLGIRVALAKAIPMAAGLGGGSSDAAAALVGANLLWKLGWTTKQLADVAAEIGSDVPYFLYGSASVCRGRGEVVDPLPDRLRLDLVVVRPPSGLSTPAVYRHTTIPSKPNRIAALLHSWRDQSHRSVSRHMFNRLQPAAAEVSPWIGRLEAEFDRIDVIGHQMSGSGSSYFGLCQSARHAQRVSSVLQSRNLGRVFRATTVSGSIPALDGASHNERRLGRGNH
jgi:4-diphosphocytidyl-2-C-methyl-D-erythritol kinase